jgi:hypothetical protein
MYRGERRAPMMSDGLLHRLITRLMTSFAYCKNKLLWFSSNAKPLRPTKSFQKAIDDVWVKKNLHGPYKTAEEAIADALSAN